MPIAVPQQNGAKLRVFLVEDSPIVRGRLEELLSGISGARIAGHATGAEQALRQILAEKPDVVVLDLKLAQGSGYDVLRALHEQAPEIDVYMLSNFASEPYRRLAAQLGAREFFDKSSEFERVRDLIAARAATQH
jgi:DNA-binding NarL/FixJ family response regulator